MNIAFVTYLIISKCHLKIFNIEARCKGSVNQYGIISSPLSEDRNSLILSYLWLFVLKQFTEILSTFRIDS